MSRLPGRPIRPLLIVRTVAVVLALAVPALAALGGDVTTIKADEIHMQGTRRILASVPPLGAAPAAPTAYTVHEIQAASGTVVREYVSPGGRVFAVTFRGPWLPDLRQLLGSYFDQYYRAVEGQNRARGGRRPVIIDEPGLTVEIGGHPRSFAGRAYVPEMLPSGVRAEDIL